MLFGSRHRTTFLDELEKGGNFPPAVHSAMDFNVDPCDNFFQYACGAWQKKAVIPAEQGGIAKSWDTAEDKSYAALHQLMLAEYPAESPYRKVHDWFKSCMDLKEVQEKKAAPLKPWLASVEAIDSHEKLWDTLVLFQLWSIPTMIKLSVSADEKEPLKHDLFLEPSGLVLPDSSYYDTEDDDDAKKHVKALHHYLKTITMLAGYSEEEACASADRTIEVEKMLAKFQDGEPWVSIEDSYMHYNKSQLEAHSPNIPWDRYFGGLSAGCKQAGLECLHSLGQNNNLVMDAPYFYQKLSEAFGNHSADFWKPYLRTHVIYNLSPLLSDDFLNATFKLDAELDGVEDQPARWHKCVAAVQHGLPGLTDQLYVKNYFPESAKKVALSMMEQLREAFIANLKNVGWMDDKTRAAAMHKARSIDFNIGSPDTWPAIWDGYKVDPSNYFENSMLAYHSKQVWKLSQVDKPVNRKEWSMRASEVNAYYDNGVTALFVPAAVLQAPFFSQNYSAERNFGGIATVMGHEFTHGFDDTGRKYDAKSRLRQWWDRPAVNKFRSHSRCISDLYEGFTIADAQVDGNGTLGENIADMGGLKISLMAYENLHEQEHGGAAPSNGDKRTFFVAFAQNWCDKERFKSQQEEVLTDEHSPDIFRVNGPVSQSHEFSRVFGCPAGSPMNPVKKCVLWKDSRPSEQLATWRRRKALGALRDVLHR
uniref:Peptidase M13 C-terminal domain-containing protein n=1 Tax=Hemiselmis tepida TaxID=464990 RepID=A0A7S0W8X8_9CRYP